MKPRALVFFALALVATLWCLTACEPGRVVNPDLFLDEMLDSVGTSAMAAASGRPFTSELDPHPSVRLWVSADAADAYARIRPDQEGSNVVLPPGTMIVREVLGADGKVAKLTAMCKGPEGWNPEIGDWWFAVTEPDGTPIDDGAGKPMIGKLAACVECHNTRGADDHLFGVPTTAR